MPKKTPIKKTLRGKFLKIYLFLGVIGFAVTVLLGSHVLEKNQVSSVSKMLYRLASNLAADSPLRYSASATNLRALFFTLPAIADSQGIEIWIVNDSGNIILNTENPWITANNPALIENFAPESWGNTYYIIGDFFDFFSKEQLSVISTITSDMEVHGYILIHYPMSRLYHEVNRRLWMILFIYLAVYIIFLLVLLIFTNRIYRSFRAILEGADALAQGNLNYQIPVDAEGELGHLACTLNYAAEQLNKDSEFRRNYISNISHDFRSPLTSIKGYVEAILDGTIPYEMQEKYLKIVSYEAERLEKLTRSIITVSNLSSHQRTLIMENFDINDTIRKSVSTFEVFCRDKKIQISLLFHGESLYVHADCEQIQQVLYNLIDNAIKFSSPGTEITVETTEQGNKVFVSVKDQGPGIPKDELSLIWDRFYKADVSRGKDRTGTGLGLSIVREIIKAHSQNIDVISTEGVGTEFIFTLDIAK